MMMIQTHGNHKKSTNKTFLPYVQNTRMSGRSHSMAHNMNNQSQIVKEPILKQYKQLTVKIILSSIFWEKEIMKM